MHRAGSPPTLSDVLEIVDDFDGANRGLIAWELMVDDEFVRAAWEQALDHGYLKAARVDAVDGEQLFVLTVAGRAALASMRGHDDSDLQARVL